MPPRKATAKKLAEGYTWKKRALEICSITCFWALWLWHFVATARWYVHSGEVEPRHVTGIAAGFVVSALVADFASGVAHWALDTWGSTETPLFGSLIRSFREHHVDQTAMTRHDFIETNGDNTLTLLPILAVARQFAVTSESATAHSFVLCLAVWVAITNQAHKWSHEVRPPALVCMAMRYRLLLDPQSHRVHHSGAHEKSYCITNGWLNPFLDAISFWRGAEMLVTALTGAVPRANDAQLLQGN
jgi:ubiquitin-conjugating enzyme E2 variant